MKLSTAVLVFVLLCSACSTYNAPIPSNIPTRTPTFDVPATLTVMFMPTATADMRTDYEKCSQGKFGLRYLVYGTAESASITLFNDTGAIEQGDYYLTFCKAYYQFKPYSSASIVAQKDTAGIDEITCEIRYNGETIAQGTSFSPYGLVSCAAAIP